MYIYFRLVDNQPIMKRLIIEEFTQRKKEKWSDEEETTLALVKEDARVVEQMNLTHLEHGKDIILLAMDLQPDYFGGLNNIYWDDKDIALKALKLYPPNISCILKDHFYADLDVLITIVKYGGMDSVWYLEVYGDELLNIKPVHLALHHMHDLTKDRLDKLWNLKLNFV